MSWPRPSPRLAALWLIVPWSSACSTWHGKVRHVEGARARPEEVRQLADAMNDIYRTGMSEDEEDRLAAQSQRRDFDVEVSGKRAFALESSLSLEGARISIGQALLQLTLTKGPTALKFLLAHELGHHATPEACTIVEEEEQADDFALRNLRGVEPTPMFEPDAATLARSAQALEDLAADLDRQLAALPKPATGPHDKRPGLCELAVELHWRASFVREKAVLGRSYTTQELRRESARIVNEVRDSRRALLKRVGECQQQLPPPSTADDPDRLLVRERIEAVRGRLSKSVDAKTVTAGDKLLNAPRSEWRDDATVLTLVRTGPWLAFKSHGALAGWLVGASFTPPFLTLSETKGSSDFPFALGFLVEYARAAETTNAQDAAVPDRALQMLRFGVSFFGDKSRRRLRFYERVRVGLGPAFNVVTKTDGSTQQQWTGFVEGGGRCGVQDPRAAAAWGHDRRRFGVRRFHSRLPRRAQHDRRPGMVPTLIGDWGGR